MVSFVDGATVQTHPGPIEFSSGLLHVYISRMVIIVWYRLDQFAFNPDSGSKEDCGVSSQYQSAEKWGQEALLTYRLLYSCDFPLRYNVCFYFTFNEHSHESWCPGQRRLLISCADAP